MARKSSIELELLESVKEVAEKITISSKHSGIEDELYYLRSKIKRYEALIGLGNLFSSSMNFENIQKKAMNKIRELIGCEHIVLYWVDDKSNTLIGRKSDCKDHYLLPINEHSFAGACAYYNAVLHIHDVRSDIRYKRDSRHFTSIDYKNILMAPLVSKGEVLGVIQVINSRSSEGDFDADDTYFIEAVANKLTNVIESMKYFDKLQAQFYQVCSALGDATIKRDRYTGGHTKRVAYFSEMIGKELDLTVDEMRDLKLSAILHDLGKIGIEDSILKKESNLTAEEFEIMKTHPQAGFEIIGHIESLKNVIDGVRYHHERPDGKGYPYGLKGDDIPLIAQVISVADTFDAMISNRPYRKGLSTMVAYQEILDFEGTQFSSRVVAGFDKAFKKSVMYRRELKLIEKKAA